MSSAIRRGWPRRDRLVTHPFPLRDDCTVMLSLPADLTLEEAKRLGQHIVTLAVDAPSSGGER